MTAILRAAGLRRAFGDRVVVEGVSLEIEAGEWVSLTGPSGCGKTTLLQMLGILDRPSAGSLELCGEDVWSSPARRQAAVRLSRVGFVFQLHNLFGHLSTRDNVALPHWRLHGSRRRALDEADSLLAELELAARGDARAQVLSAGEAQRAAIARALINRPALVLADEPTGSLDSHSGERVLAALELACARGAALLVVTHDSAVGARGRRLSMRDGRLVEGKDGRIIE